MRPQPFKDGAIEKAGTGSERENKTAEVWLDGGEGEREKERKGAKGYLLTSTYMEEREST